MVAIADDGFEFLLNTQVFAPSSVDIGDDGFESWANAQVFAPSKIAINANPAG
jgi:hypothetical protein